MNGNIFHPGSHSTPTSLGLLLVRVGAGVSMAVTHGWGKLIDFGAKAATFPDPLHIGHRASMAGAIGGEFFCPLLIALGLATRVAALPSAFTMAVAGFVVLAHHPWGDRELAVLYLLPFLGLVLTGAGRFSLDARMSGGKGR